MKQGLNLTRVVLLGRTLDEYVRFFGLKPEDLRGKSTLDIAAGVSSFCAEANAAGHLTTALDPIYELSPKEIRRRCEPDLDFIVSTIGNLSVYKWDFYKSPERLREYRERSYRTFLEDFHRHGMERYQPGSLPELRFQDGQFDLTLVSYFLFVYQDQLDYEFHRESILETMRVTRGELRIYPVVTFEAERSRHIDRLHDDPALAHLAFEEVPTDFEFLRNSNRYLRVRHRD